jgi:hypothetical protein
MILFHEFNTEFPVKVVQFTAAAAATTTTATTNNKNHKSVFINMQA